MKIIDIQNGVVVDVSHEYNPADAFVDTIIDAAELAQKAERLCPDDPVLRRHVEQILKSSTALIAESAVRVMPRRVH